MTIKHLSCVLALGVSLLSACNPKTNVSSKLDGHYENADEGQLLTKASSIRAAAEYEPSQGVIISLPLISNFGKNDFAAALVGTGIETLWIVVPSNFEGDVQSSPIFADLRERLGSSIRKIQLIPQQTTGDLTVWSRDWAPQSSIKADGSVGLIDFNYYPERDADDFTAQSMEKLLEFDRVSVPVYNEGGNFMNTTQGHCLMTTRVIDANNQLHQADDMILSAEDVEGYYKVGAGCKKVTIFPRMPYEGTGHIDMWAKFLNDTTLVVSELRDEQLALYTGDELKKVLNIQKYLTERAIEIEQMGYKVLRLPIPGPAFSAQRDSFRSYSNSITVNGHVIIPRYRTPFFSDLGVEGKYRDDGFLLKYEQEVQSVYESQGYKVAWITSDDLIARGGAVHCTTMQIARAQ